MEQVIFNTFAFRWRIIIILYVVYHGILKTLQIRPTIHRRWETEVITYDDSISYKSHLLLGKLIISFTPLASDQRKITQTCATNHYVIKINILCKRTLASSLSMGYFWYHSSVIEYKYGNYGQSLCAVEPTIILRFGCKM